MGRVAEDVSHGGYSATATLAIAAATFVATIATMKLLKHVRRAARNRARYQELFPPSPPHDMEAQLDEELDQTFPASDPIPYMHRVD
jgi:hypothetical protein